MGQSRENPGAGPLGPRLPGDIAGVVLAGGQSSRMGTPKALLPIEGRTFLATVTSALLDGGAREVVVVLGHDGERVAASVPRDHRVRVVVNPAPEQGQLSSLQTALRAIGPEAGAAVVTLVDVPLAGADVVASLIASWRATGAPVVRPERRGRHGHPVIFSGEALAALREADPAAGAKPVLARFARAVMDVPWEGDGPFTDLDTRADYERHIGQWPHS